ncbi:MAG: acyclic terpene utilization AtuA family protein [Acidobacteriota bacterium]
MPLSSKKTIRVGNAGGYWGDDLDALPRQLMTGSLDYVTQDFLAEVTMSVLQKQRSRNPALGYAVDFVEQMRKCLPLLEQNRTRIISNAGGINPHACADRILESAAEQGIKKRIAVVSGDDLMDRLDDFLARGVPLENMETGERLQSIRERIQSANAYLGSAPVARALEEGADIVITGRVTDSGITVAIPIFEFGWSFDDWDRLASAVVAGHILECGAQATGGNITDWEEVPSFQSIGYPIAELSPDGSFIATKPEGSGGLVSQKTIISQLIYEIGDPRRYMTPDVIADFSTIQLEDKGRNRVRVSDVKGRPRTDQLKVSISYHDGYKAHAQMIVSGPRATDKCRRVADVFWKELQIEFEETITERIGDSACKIPSYPSDPAEVLLRFGVRDRDRDKVEEFAKKSTSLLLRTMPGIAIVGARPRIQDVIAYWPCLIPAGEVQAQVELLKSGASSKFQVPSFKFQVPSFKFQVPSSKFGVPESASAEKKAQRLGQIAYARSGDKGNRANIGVIARSPESYAWLREQLTAERVKIYFKEICKGKVERFELPNLLAFNFLLHDALGGGGTKSLRIDPQGKTLGEALLMMQLELPEGLC